MATVPLVLPSSLPRSALEETLGIEKYRGEEEEQQQEEREQEQEDQENERGLQEGQGKGGGGGGGGGGEGKGEAPDAVEVHALEGYPIRALVRERERERERERKGWIFVGIFVNPRDGD